MAHRDTARPTSVPRPAPARPQATWSVHGGRPRLRWVLQSDRAPSRNPAPALPRPA